MADSSLAARDLNKCHIDKRSSHCVYYVSTYAQRMRCICRFCVQVYVHKTLDTSHDFQWSLLLEIYYNNDNQQRFINVPDNLLGVCDT